MKTKSLLLTMTIFTCPTTKCSLSQQKQRPSFKLQQSPPEKWHVPKENLIFATQEINAINSALYALKNNLILAQQSNNKNYETLILQEIAKLENSPTPFQK